MMSVAELSQLMLKHGLVIRAIYPHEQERLFETHHKEQYPEGVIKYSERNKRDALHVPYRNSQGGKFVITSDRGQSSTVRWSRDTVFYDSIEHAIESFVNNLP